MQQIEGAQDRLAVASRLAGTAVMDSQGNEVATLEDLVVDRGSGRIAYGLVTRRGQESRLYPVPWASLTIGPDGTFTLSVPASTLDWAPAYHASQTPDWADREWGKGLHAHYQVRPYWDLP